MALALLNPTRVIAVSAAVRVGLTVIAPILAVCALSAPPLSSSSSCQPPSTVATRFHYQAPTPQGLTPSDTSDALGNDAAVVVEREAKSASDLYGNEVIEAVARYELDDEGSLYEVHSPQTELPNLASPIS